MMLVRIGIAAVPLYGSSSLIATNEQPYAHMSAYTVARILADWRPVAAAVRNGGGQVTLTR
jgi:hypothetical protein